MQEKRKPKSIRKWIRRQKVKIYQEELGKNPGYLLKWRKNILYCIDFKGKREKIREI